MCIISPELTFIGKLVNTSTDQDAAQLQALGYGSNFDRSMSLWANFSLGFTYLSPVVGVYTLFAFAIAAGGPPMFWNYLLVAVGQLLVAMVFGEIVSQFPIAGGLYPWARRLVGKRWAWMAGWIYLWALCATIAGVAVGGAPFLADLLGIKPSPAGLVAIAVGLIVATTALNLSGTKLLARVATFGFICELLGAPKQEIWIHRHRHEMPGVKVFMGVGATIDYEAGAVTRAPNWMRHGGLEWLYRVLTEPRRYALRYARNTEFLWLAVMDGLGFYKSPMA